MSRIRRSRDISIHTVIFAALLTAVSGLVFAQSGSVEIPENARAKSYGIGWECVRGFRTVDAACVAIDVPANAHPTNASYGRGWECDRGYREVEEACAPIELPPNAYLNSYGDKWKCDRGYRVVDKICVAVNPRMDLDGNAIAGIERLMRPALPSRCLQTRTQQISSTGALGNAFEAIGRWMRPASPSSCRRMPI
jgi:hypothetical protein